MATWINRTVVAAPRNATTSHTVSFTAATSGNLLVAVIQGAVTSTTPTGWTLPSGGSAVNNAGLYVWYKTATAGESSFTTTHNGSNYPVYVTVYEFSAGATFVGAQSGTAFPATGSGPSLSGLTGTNQCFGTVGGIGGTTQPSWSWTGPSGIVTDVNQSTPQSGTDGYAVSIGYLENSVATSFTPAWTATNGTSFESISFAIKVAASASSVRVHSASVGTASVTASGTASLSGTGTLTATATVATSGTVALSGSGLLSATGKATTSGVAALTGAGVLGATGVAGTTVTDFSGTATLSGGGTLTAQGAVTVSGTAPLTGTGTLSASGKVSDLWRFHTPTFIERTNSRHPLLARTKTQVGISVLKTGEFYRQVRFPSCEEIAAADAVYLGGYDHTVSGAEATALRAAGYTDLTPIVDQ